MSLDGGTLPAVSDAWMAGHRSGAALGSVRYSSIGSSLRHVAPQVSHHALEPGSQRPGDRQCRIDALDDRSGCEQHLARRLVQQQRMNLDRVRP